MVYHDVSETRIKYENNQGKELVDGLLKLMETYKADYTQLFALERTPAIDNPYSNKTTLKSG